MFYLNKERELTVDLLYKMINSFRTSVEPKLQKYKNYYDGEQDIKNKSYKDATKPCNKTVINYCKNIVDSYCGYLATPDFISYSSQNDIEDVMEIMKYNDYQAEDNEFLRHALIHSVACELMYIDDEGKTRFRLINPLTCFGVYDNSLTEDLLYFVRIYKANDWDEADLLHYVDVYSDTSIKHYSMLGNVSSLSFLSEEPHYFGQCPANILVMPDEKSIFDCIMGLQDSANTLLSAEIDDYEAFCDAYLTLEGADTDADYSEMKENRILVLPVGAKAAWLTKNANDAQVENILRRIHDSIYRIAACPDFSSESFVGGVSSGIAIQYRLTGMETRAGKIEAVMKKALQRRVEIICGIASLKLGEEIFRDIQIDFKRNIPVDEAAIVNMALGLKGIVSDATILGMLPFVSDVNTELEAVKKQKEENMATFGNNLLFGSGEDEDDGTEDSAE